MKWIPVASTKIVLLVELVPKCNKHDNRNNQVALTYLCTPPTQLPLTSHDSDSIVIRGTDHFCSVFVMLIMCDVTRLGFNQLFLGLTTFFSVLW